MAEKQTTAGKAGLYSSILAIFTFSNINFWNPFCRHVQSRFHSSRDTGQLICISLHAEIYIETAFARDPHTSILICKLQTHTLH